MHAEEMSARHRQKSEQLGRMVGEIDRSPLSSAGEHAKVARGRLAQMNAEWSDLQNYVGSRKQRLHEMYKFSQFIAGVLTAPGLSSQPQPLLVRVQCRLHCMRTSHYLLVDARRSLVSRLG